MGLISQNNKILAYTASGATTPLESSVIDMLQWESAIAIGAATSPSTAQGMKLLMSTASASGGMSEATGNASAIYQSMYLEVVRPIKRYIQFQWTASGTSSPARGLTVLLNGGWSLPVTQDATTTGKVLYSPGSGTATA